MIYRLKNFKRSDFNERKWYQSIKDVVKDKENFDEYFEKSIIQDFKLDEQKLCDIINNIECDNDIKK